MKQEIFEDLDMVLEVEAGRHFSRRKFENFQISFCLSPKLHRHLYILAKN